MNEWMDGTLIRPHLRSLNDSARRSRISSRYLKQYMQEFNTSMAKEKHHIQWHVFDNNRSERRKRRQPFEPGTLEVAVNILTVLSFSLSLFVCVFHVFESIIEQTKNQRTCHCFDIYIHKK